MDDRTARWQQALPGLWRPRLRFAEAVGDFAADSLVRDVLHVLKGSKRERQRQPVHRRQQGSDQSHIFLVKIDCADPWLLDGFHLAGLAPMEHADLKPA